MSYIQIIGREPALAFPSLRPYAFEIDSETYYLEWDVAFRFRVGPGEEHTVRVHSPFLGGKKFKEFVLRLNDGETKTFEYKVPRTIISVPRVSEVEPGILPRFIIENPKPSPGRLHSHSYRQAIALILLSFAVFGIVLAILEYPIWSHNRDTLESNEGQGTATPD